MAWLPGDGGVYLHVAVELVGVAAARVVLEPDAHPIVAAPSLNATVPVGEPGGVSPGKVDTVAVNVTCWPKFEELGVAESAVLVS
jgi:hypothetical protein